MYGGDYYGIDYVQLVPILIKAVKEQNREINKLKSILNG